MRVAIVNYASRPDVETAAQLLDKLFILTGWASQLCRAGCETRVFQGFREDDELEHRSVTYQLIAGRFTPDLPRWWVPRRLHAQVASWAPEVVHLHGLTYPLQLLDLRSCLDRSCTMIVQHHGERPMRGWRRLVQRAAVRRADAVLFNGLELARPWLDCGTLDRSTPALDVPEGSSTLEPGAFTDQAACRRRLGIEGEPLLLWAGNLDVNKDPLVVLGAVSRLSEKLPGIRLLMAFRGATLLDEVRERVTGDAALRDRVELLGRQPYERIAELMAAADYLVQASWREGSGFAVLDALACGLPPVVSDIPSFRYLTGNGSIGALFRPGDADDLVSKLLASVSQGNPTRGEPALVWFRKKLSWPAVIHRAMAAYRLSRCHRAQAIARRASEMGRSHLAPSRAQPQEVDS